MDSISLGGERGVVMSYKLAEGGIIRLSDNTFIPFGSDTSAMSEYLAWLQRGFQPIPADPPPVYRSSLKKSTIVRRMTDEELAISEAARDQATIRQKLLWENAHNNEVWANDPELIDFFAMVLGSRERAEELMQPE